MQEQGENVPFFQWGHQQDDTERHPATVAEARQGCCRTWQCEARQHPHSEPGQAPFHDHTPPGPSGSTSGQPGWQQTGSAYLVVIAAAADGEGEESVASKMAVHVLLNRTRCI